MFRRRNHFMKLRIGRRMLALFLTVVMAMCAVPFPSADVLAEETVVSGTITEADGVKRLSYGSPALDTALFEQGAEPIVVTKEEDIAYFNEMETITMTMVFRYREPVSKNHAFFALEGNDGEHITFWQNPLVSNNTQGRISFDWKGSQGIFGSRDGHKISDTNYHKLTVSYVPPDANTTATNVYFAIDGVNTNMNLTNLASNWYGKINELLQGESPLHTFTIGGKGKNTTYNVTAANGGMYDFDGDIKYMEFSSKKLNANEVVAENQKCPDGLFEALSSYITTCESTYQKENEDGNYPSATWEPYETALTAAKTVTASTPEWVIYNKYDALKAAEDALKAGGKNIAPTAVTDGAAILVQGKTLTMSGKDLATDANNDLLTITSAESAEAAAENIGLNVEDGLLKIRCAEGYQYDPAHKETPFTVNAVVSDGVDEVNASFSLYIEQAPLKLEYNDIELDPAHDEEVMFLEKKEIKKLTQIEESLEVSMTFRYDASKAFNKNGENYYYLMEIGDSENNYSEKDNNGLAGANPPARAHSSLALILNVSSGTVYMNTGAWEGSTDWTLTGLGNLNDGRYHTLTVSISPAAFNVYCDAQNLKTASGNTAKNTKNFVRAFFGETIANSGDFYRDWRRSIDTVTIGSCNPNSATRHENYGKFGGEIKSFVISDGAYSQASLSEHHKSYGTDEPKKQLRQVFESISERDYAAEDWAVFTATETYRTVKGVLDDTAPTYAANIYNTLISQMQTAISDFISMVNNKGLTDLGSGISAMFNMDPDNTWIFGGGVEAQGRFSEIAGVRNYIGQFEEYIRWVNATDSPIKRQRYMVNVGKAGASAKTFYDKMDQYIEKLDPKAIAYLIGPEDYKKGQAGITEFQTALTGILDKALAVKGNTGFAVIQFPHAGKAGDAEQINLYVNAARDTLRSYVSAHAAVKDRIVLADHTTLTDNEDFKQNKLTAEGYLNAEGHREIAMQLSQATFKSTAGFPVLSYWTSEDMPQEYKKDSMPAVTAEAGGRLSVVIPSDISSASTTWEYTLEIDDLEMKGTAQEGAGRAFTIDGLPQNEAYVLCLKSTDNHVQLAKVYGKTEAGNRGGQETLTQLQQKIREKADAKDQPLTWLFMGDSITHAAKWTNGYDGIAQIFEKYLKEDLGRSDDIVVNTGVSSATTTETLAYIDQRLMKYHPDIVSVMLGTNDTQSQYNTSADQYEDNLIRIVSKIRESNEKALIIFRTPTPSSSSRYKDPLEDRYLERMHRVADADGNILLIDQYTEWNKEMNTFPYLYQRNYYYGSPTTADALHPSTQGQLRMAQQFIRECGLSTDTRIANLAYRFGYTEETSETTPNLTAGRVRAALEESEIEKLEGAYGQSFGMMQVTLTDQADNRTYTRTAYTDEARFIMRYLQNEGGHNYRVSVTGMPNGSAKKVTFKEGSLSLSPQNPVLPFYVFLDAEMIRDWTVGSVIGTLSVGKAAPDGTHHYELVGSGNDNEKFVIEGSQIKVKTELEEHQRYTVCVQAVSDDDPSARSITEEFTFRTLSSLEHIREDARDLFESDKSALDLDLSDVDFSGQNYLDFADPASKWYQNGDYLRVLNTMQKQTTGGTIIYRFRTTQEDAVIFATGSDDNVEKNLMCFGLKGGDFREILRASEDRWRGSHSAETKLNDGAWHTVAISFDTTKADFQNQLLVCVDGGANIYPPDWWQETSKSWFNINPNDAITNFAIGGGFTEDISLASDLPKFHGDISFVTVTDEIYDEDELKIISRTPLITGQQTVSINGSTVAVSEDANYTASAVVPSAEDAQIPEFEFTLTAKGEYLFDKSVSVDILNRAALGINTNSISVFLSNNGKSLTVRYSTQAWRADTVVELEELSFRAGEDNETGRAFTEEMIEKLGTMRRGSLTVRYKLDAASAASNSRFALFSVSNGTLEGYSSFYIIPASGTIGYEIRNQEGSASRIINADSAVREQIKNTNWHTITYTFQASGTNVYLDGVRVLANKKSGFLSSTSDVDHARVGAVCLGEDHQEAYPFAGEINALHVTYDVLDADTAAILHAATAAEHMELPDSAEKTEDAPLYYADYDDSPYYDMPALLTTSGGTMIAAADKRQTTSAERGNIDTVIRRSTDNGKTWSSPQVLFNQPDGGVMYSFTTAPILLEGENHRIHMVASLFPESQGTLTTGRIEKGSGFKEVDGTLYPVLRNYPNTVVNAANQYTEEYTVREGGTVWREPAEGSGMEASQTNYKVDYLSAENSGDLYLEIGSERTYCGNIYVYTGENAGQLKVPRVMSLVTCYSDDDGETWEGYQNITGMVKEDWMKFIRAGAGSGICLSKQKTESLNGRLMIPVCYTNGSGNYSYNVSIIYSDDNGVTWQMTESPIEQAGNVSRDDIISGTFREEALRESQIVEMADGTLKMFSSNYSGWIKMSTGTVTAEGITWTKIEQTTINDMGVPVSVIHAPWEIDGKEAVILSTPLGPDANNGYLYVGLYQADGTFEWKYLQKIKADEYGNSSLGVLSDKSIGVLYKGSEEDIVFTGMNQEWLTAPRSKAFGIPVIEDIEMQQDGKDLTFTVKLDSVLMKKGSPFLKIKVAGEEARAEYVSGNASKQYVFRYEINNDQAVTVEAVNVGAGDDGSFIESVTGLMPADAGYVFTADAVREPGSSGGENGNEDQNEDEKKEKLAAPNIISLKAVAEKKAMGVKIQVQKAARADVVTVYRKNGTAVTKIGAVNAAGIVYDQNPVSNKTLSYYAVAEASSGKYLASNPGPAKSIKLNASVKKITVKKIGKKPQVRISWKKVKKAKQYIIYRSKKKDSGYVKIKTVKKNASSFTDKKVKKGGTYYYRIVVKLKKGYSGIKTSKAIKVKK